MATLKRLVAFMAVAVIFGGAPSSADATVIIESDHQGWVNSLGLSNGTFNGNNTFTGNEFTQRFNSWASFDLSGLTDNVVSATLDITTAIFPSGDSALYELGIYDVSTPLVGLTGVAAYTDLGTGNLYASGFFTGGTSALLALSAQAVSDIIAATGGTFIIGFTNITLNGVPSGPGDDIGLYTNNNSANSPTLILETGAAVPEPTSLVLLGAGLLGLAASRRRSA